MYGTAYGSGIVVKGTGVYPAIDAYDVNGTALDGGAIAAEGAAADVYRTDGV